MTTILVPLSLTWDKLCALYLIVRILFPRQIFKTFFEALAAGANVMFEDEQDVPDDVIDVDVRKRYNRSQGQYGSATEKVAIMYGLNLPGLEYLIHILNQNNETGYLKSFSSGSLVLLIRELFNVGAANPSVTRRRQVINLLWPVLVAYFQAAETAPQKNDKKNPTSWANPFTMEALEVWGGNRITAENIDALNQAFARVKKLQEQSQARVEKLQPEVFTVPAWLPPGQLANPQTSREFKGHWIATDNTRIAALWFEKHPDVVVIVTQRKSGNTAIFCRGKQDFSHLYQALEDQEGESGLWFLDTRPGSPMLLNGSTSRYAEPTNLSKPELIALIQAKHRHKSRKYQPRD